MIATDLPTLALRRGLRGLLRPVVRVARGLVVVGAHHLPDPGARVIFACNHAAYVDTVALACALRAPFVVLGAKERLFRSPARRALLRVALVAPLRDREGFLADGAAILDRGLAVLCYPELGRHPEGLAPFSTWPAELALATGAVLVPLHLRGTTRGDPPGWRVGVAEPLPPTGNPQALTDALLDRVRALRDA